ncbi:hypothetical protein [Pontibacter mangrovi]|uniref:DUF4296 domain-containing protein n=1 Tax=Pontibacter mangrovi TaxID=2589816 RepID=A0A501W5R3_9BACT|nr:hypothetical protein [Pontibacter mangrovi]TPE44082.1 hypothetical protein FJM65_11740 [Pontibacter mangrovi]
MNKRIIPLLAFATMLAASSCSYDKTGTSFEVVNANEDEAVNPNNIRGYGNREPDMGDVNGPKPSDYYAFSINDVPADMRQQLEGNVAVEMVRTYYSPDRQLSDLYEQYNPSGKQSQPSESPAAPASNNNSGNSSGDTQGSSGNATSGNGNDAGNQQ